MRVLIILLLVFLFASCEKESDKTCWDCEMKFSIGGPNRDTIICDNDRPDFEPKDPNGNVGTVSCTER